MALIKAGKLVADAFSDVSGSDSVDAPGAVIVSLAQWLEHRDELLARGVELGIRLSSAESPDRIAGDVGQFSVIALEFPAFRDGRAYSYARLLRERHGFKGELRAVGDVLLEQLHFMARTGFDAFEISGPDPEKAYATAMSDMSVWYQPTADGRRTAMQLRHCSD